MDSLFPRLGVSDGSTRKASAACAGLWGRIAWRGRLLVAMMVGLFCLLGGGRVQAQIVTTTTLGSSTASTTYGSIVLLTATVSSSSATGTVTFLNGTTMLGTGTLTSGVATLDSTGLPLGTNSVTAVYSGDSTYKTSTSNTVTVMVTVPPTNVGATSATLAVPVSFTSTATLNATLGTAIQVLTTGIAGLDFQYVSSTAPGTCAAGATYTSGESCTVNLTFAPLAPGVRLGAVELFTAAGTAPVGLAYVSGIGDGPLVGMVPGTISTVVGSGAQCAGGTGTICGDGGSATVSGADLYYPTEVAVDGAGNLYIADSNDNRIRKVTAATGDISTVAGSGTECSPSTATCGDGGSATDSGVDLSYPNGVAVDGAGNVYIADSGDNRIRKVTVATGDISTVAGSGTACSGGTGTICGDGGSATAAGAELNGPARVAVDGAGNLYIADTHDQRIRKVTAATGDISTVAGSGTGCTGGTGTICGDGGSATAAGAELYYPAGVAVDGAGNLYIADTDDQRIRKVTAATGHISTVAGSGTTCSSPTATCGDGGSATASAADLNVPNGVAVDGAGNLYIADTYDQRIRKVTAATGFISTVAGSGTACSGGTGTICGDGGSATAAGADLNYPEGLAVDGAGNLYIADDSDNRIRKVTAAANPLTFASTAVAASSAAQTVTLTNNGNATLTATALATSNSNFTLSGSTCTATGTVASGNTCTIGVKFTPQALGSQTGTASYTDNALNVAGTVQSIALSGTATIGAQTITFPQPTTPVTTNTSATLTATASSGLAVTYLITVGNGATLSGTDNSTITYTGVGSVLITAFQLGNSNYSMATQVSRTVTIFDATTFTAPTTNVGTTSATQTVTMTIATAGTTASTQAAGIKVSTQGATGLDFSYVSGGTCAVSTAYTAGQTCTVDISFTPTHPWVRYGGITLVSSAGTVLAQSFVTGTGTGPQVVFPEGTAEASSTLGGGFSDQGGVAVDGNGNVYVADTYHSEVKKIPAGCTSSSCVTVLGGGFSYLQDVAVDGSGNVYVADYDTASVKVMAASCTSSSCVKTLGGGFTAPAGVAVDGSGNVYVADSGTNLVQEMAAGCASSSCVSTLGGGFSEPYGVAVDSSGNIYVADYGNSKVKEMAAGCSSSSCVTTLGGASTFSSPMGVAVDGSGNVYVADTSNNLVREMTANCTTSSCVSTLGSGFDNPEGVAVDGSGNVYGSDSYHNAVREMVFANAPALTFASTAVGATSTAQSVPVSNDGNAALTLSSFAATINFSTAAGSCGASLSAGSVCDASFAFAPTVTGSLTGTGTITDNMLNVSGSTQTMALSGTATAATGTTAQTITFTQPTTPVVNGASPITLSASSTSGLTVHFAVTSGSATVSGSMLTITGPGTVVVTAYQDGNTTYKAATPVSQNLVVTVPSTNVGAASATQLVTLNITTAGTLNATLGTAIQVLTMGFAGLDFGYVSGGTCAVSTAYTVGQSCTVEVSFTPAVPGVRMGAVELFTASGTAPIAVAYILGTGTGPLVGIAPGTISTIAGNGTECSTSASTGCMDGGAATSAELDRSQGMALDGAGNLYIADTFGYRVREVTAATGIITTVAGTGSNATVTCSGYTDSAGDGCLATGAELFPAAVALDGAGNLYIVDQGNNRIREVSATTGIITTVAGNGSVGSVTCTGYTDSAGDGCVATSARLINPEGLTLDGAGNLYIGDFQDYRIRKVTAATGIITTVAGNGSSGTVTCSGYTDSAGDGCAATSAQLNYPQGISVDGAGNLYIADSMNDLIRKVTASTGIITTVAGGGSSPSTCSGSTDNAGDGCVATSAEINGDFGVLVDGAGNLYIADSTDNRIRKVTATADPIAFATSTAVGATDTTDGAQIVTLSNNGNASMTLSFGSSSVSFPVAATAIGTNTPACGSTLASGAQCGVEATFTPVVSGVLTGTENITNNSLNVAGSLQTVSLSGTATAATGATAQTITFTQPTTPVAIGASPITLSASATSGLTVYFTVTSGPATVSGTTLTITGVGAVEVTAYQNGNATYAAATPVTQTIAVTMPSTNVGATSPTETVTVNITTSGTLHATLGTAIQVLTQGVTLLDFGYVSGGTCVAGTAYTSGQSCTVNVNFTPATAGLRIGAVVLYDTSATPVPLATAYISGIGNGPLAGFAPGTMSTVAGTGTGGYVAGQDGGPATSAKIDGPNGVALDGAGNLYIADTANQRIRKVSAGTSIITTVAGTGTSGYVVGEDGGAATSAELSAPVDVAVDGAGNLYIAEVGDQRIQMVTTATGIITTVAGTGTAGYVAGQDGGPATSAELNHPESVAVDGAGNLYIADYLNNRIRKVTASTGIITTVAGTGTGGYVAGQDGGLATSAEIKSPLGVAVDSAGNLYIADTYNQRIREVTASTGIITTVAGTGTAGYVAAQDGGAATSAEINYPVGVAVDGAGNLYIGDVSNNLIRKVTAGIITTVAGDGTGGYTTDNIAATSAEMDGPQNIVVDGAGNLYIADYFNNRVRMVTAAAAAVSFASTAVGASSTAQLVTMVNNGNASLSVSSLAASANFNLSGAGGTCATGSLAAATNCILSLVFAPTAPGSSITGTATVTDNTLNVTGSTQVVNLSGTGAGTAQTITFPQPATPAGLSTTATLSATGGASGNPVTFAITGGTGTATLSGTNNSTIAYTGLGTVQITASQAGNTTYDAAANVIDTVTVEPVSAITWSPAATTMYTGAAIGASVLNANSTTAGTFAYTATIANGSPVAVTSASTLTEGSYALTANFTPSDTTANALATMTQSFTVQNMNPFVVNSSGAVSSDYNNGTNASAATSGGGIGAAVDSNGYVWSINTSGSSVSKFTNAGALSVSYSGASISGATALAIDGKGVVWIANGAGTISALTNAGAADVSPPIASAGNLSTPSSISVDAAGSLWVANSGNGTVTEVIGVAAPVVAPVVTAVTNSSMGTRP